MRCLSYTKLARAGLVLLLVSAGGQAFAQVPAGSALGAPEPRPRAVRGAITMAAGTGQVIRLTANSANVFTADPKVVEVRPASPNSLFVFGVAPGTTTVAALGPNGEAIGQYQVTVLPSGFDAAQARGALSRSGNAGVTTRTTETGVQLSGHVPTAADAQRAVNTARGVLPPDAKVDNQLSVDESIQVGLHVRIAEMTRTLTRELGINWEAVGQLGSNVVAGVTTSNALSAVAGVSPSSGIIQLGSQKRGYGLDAVIDALSQDQLVHVLAEPNLTTISGQPASFLVGGEFPIPVATTQASGSNAGTFSIDFKQYGISLAFVPTVLSHDRISLHVRPEVSQLDKANGVTSFINSNVAISIPALTVRRADTTVELGSGQSFAIAGLLSDQTTQITQATPGLGDIPILGSLFRSDSFMKQETELVIVVTPYIVRPVSDPNALHLSTDIFREPNDLERILELRQIGHGSYKNYRPMPAQAGFMVE